MGDYVEGLKEAEKTDEKITQSTKSRVALVQQELTMRQKISQLMRGGSSSQIANNSSTTSPTANNGGGNSTGYSNGGNPYSADQAGPYTGGTASGPPKFGGSDAGKEVLKGLGGAAIGLMGFLPTVEEATTAQLMKSRMTFYGRQGQYPSGNQTKYTFDEKTRSMVRSDHNAEAAFRQTRDFANLGTAMTPSDAQSAINNGIQMGFLPALSNYGMGAPGKTTGFSGILGGAALASNLSPGIGIQGGMAAMGSLNQAQNVNMLRMLGVQVRNSKGTGMNDLPAIIEQIYKLLARGGNINMEDVATSLMPGNALDSMLNQYLGGDANLKNVVISGLVQRIRSGKSLRLSGTKEELQKTGGTSFGVRSMASRSTSELGLIQSYTDSTVNAMNTANTGLGKLYGGLATGQIDIPVIGGLNVKDYIIKAQNLSTKLDVYTGARGNAGQAVLQSLINSGHTGFDTSGKLGKTVFGLLGAAAVAKGALHVEKGVFKPTEYLSGNSDFYGNPVNSASPSNPGQIYTGAITVNVAAPPGQDPYSYGLAIGQAMTARS
jgi:hypothetical protein